MQVVKTRLQPKIQQLNTRGVLSGPVKSNPMAARSSSKTKSDTIPTTRQNKNNQCYIIERPSESRSGGGYD